MTLIATALPEPWDSTIQIVSFISSVVALVMSIFAIWLSSRFADQSSRDAGEIEESNRAIQQGVVKLEKMVEMQQNYLVPMLRDLVGKFNVPDAASAEKSEHLVERKVSEKVEQVKADLTSQVVGLLDRAGKSDPRLVEVSKEVVGAVEKAVDLGRDADREAREENVKDQLLNYLNALPSDDRRMTVFALVFNFRDKFAMLDIIKALNELRQEGVVEFDRPINDWQEITSDMTFTYSPPA